MGGILLPPGTRNHGSADPEEEIHGEYSIPNPIENEVGFFVCRYCGSGAMRIIFYLEIPLNGGCKAVGGYRTSQAEC